MDVQPHAQLHFPGIVAIRCSTGCQQGKLLTIEFFYCHKANRAGFDTRCRDCRNGTRRAWRAVNAERINARRRELYAIKKAEKISRSPEPAESDDPDQNATGGVLIPSMVAEQSGEQDAGEAATVGASAVPSPVLLAPGDPASVEGASADARGHAPPAFLSDEIDDDEAGWRQALLAIAAGGAVQGSVVRDLIGVGYVHATPTRLILTEEGEAFLQGETAANSPAMATEIPDAAVKGYPSPADAGEDVSPKAPDGMARTEAAAVTGGESAAATDPEPVPLGLDAGATAPGRDPIELPAFLSKMPNSFSGMDRSDPNTVEGKHGATSAAEHDARPASSLGGRASFSFYDPGPIPEFLLRKKSAA